MKLAANVINCKLQACRCQLRVSWVKCVHFSPYEADLRCEPEYVIPCVANLAEEKSYISTFEFPSGLESRDTEKYDRESRGTRKKECLCC
jgi:hypothetical protein